MPDDAAGVIDDAGGEDNPDDTTESVQTRWDYTNDVAALLLVGSFALAFVAGAWGIATGNVDASLDMGLLTYGLIVLVLLAGTWLFGADAFDALSRLRGG